MVRLGGSEIPDKGKGLLAVHVLSQVNPESAALTAFEGGRMRVHQDKHQSQNGGIENDLVEYHGYRRQRMEMHPSN